MRERGLVALGWIVALALSAAILALAACGGPSPLGSAATPAASSAEPSADATASAPATASWTPAPNESPSTAVGEGELRDGSGKVVAEPTGSEEIDAAELAKRVANDPAWAQQLENARVLGFTGVGAAAVTRYDDGTEVTSAVLANGDVDRAILVHASGTMSGDYIVRPLLAGGTVSSLEILGADGTVTVDLARGEISGVDTHRSCSYWNCVGGAIYYWIQQNTFWDVVGTICDICFTGGVCDLCLLRLPAVAVATASGCAAFPCAWCYSDSCGGMETVDRWCTAEAGAPQVFESIRSHSCQNARATDSECVERTDTKSVEVCWNGCAGNNCAPVTCQSHADCPPDAQDLGTVCLQGLPGVNPNIGQVFRYTERSWCNNGTCSRACAPNLIDVCAEGCWDSPPGSTGTAVADVAPACNAESLPPGTGRCFSATACTRDENIYVRSLRPGTGKGPGNPPVYVYSLAPRECYTDPATGSLSSGQPYRHYYPVRLPNGSQTCTWEKRHRDVTTCTGNCLSGTCDPTCDPNVCAGETRVGDQHCDEGLLSAVYRQRYCQGVAGGGSTCATRDVRHSFATCTSGCKPDKRPGAHDSQCQGGQCSLDCAREEVLATFCRAESGTAELVEQVRQYYCDSTVTSGDACRSRTMERTTACPGGCLTNLSACAHVRSGHLLRRHPVGFPVLCLRLHPVGS